MPTLADIGKALPISFRATPNHVYSFFTTVANDLNGKLPEVSNFFGVGSDTFERFY